MDVTYHALKNVRNKRKHGIYLSRAADFDMSTALLSIDDREDYGEERWTGIGLLEGLLYVLIFTFTETGIHAISLRKARPHEEKDYAG